MNCFILMFKFISVSRFHTNEVALQHHIHVHTYKSCNAQILTIYL